MSLIFSLRFCVRQLNTSNSIRLCSSFAVRNNDIAVIRSNEEKVLKVAIIGVPNAGKSTLINQLLDLNVCPVSKRPHTTRKGQRAALLDQSTQVIFLDTPGLVNSKEKKKFSFNDDFVNSPENAIKRADLVAVLHEVSSKIYRNKLDRKLIKILEKFYMKKTILILNKIDVLRSKLNLLESVRILTNGKVNQKPVPVSYGYQSHEKLNMEEILKVAKKEEFVNTEEPNNVEYEEKVGWGSFDEVFMISALHGDGVSDLKKYFVNNAEPSPWEHKDDFVTDIPTSDLIIDIIKAKILEHLPHEVPYKISPKLEMWEPMEDGTIRIGVTILCPTERYKKVVIGYQGQHIQRITTESKNDLMRVLGKYVDLIIQVNEIKKEKNNS